MWTSVGLWWHLPFWRVLCWSVTVQKFPDFPWIIPTKERKTCNDADLDALSLTTDHLNLGNRDHHVFFSGGFKEEWDIYENYTRYQSGLQTLLSRFWSSGWSLNINLMKQTWFHGVLVRVRQALPNHCLETSEDPSVSFVFSCVLMHFRYFWETFGSPLPSHGLNAELENNSSFHLNFPCCFFFQHFD